MNAETSKCDNNRKQQDEPAHKAGVLTDLQPPVEKTEEVKGGIGLLLPAVQKVY